VRELENLIERLVLTLGGRVVRPDDLGLPTVRASTSMQQSEGPLPFRTIREMERWLIVKTLTQRMGNRTQAARDLEISLRTLRNKINEYQIVEPETLPRTGIASPRQLGNPRSASSDQAEAAG
jgi:DNA-binding NtrC family response regulator